MNFIRRPTGNKPVDFDADTDLDLELLSKKFSPLHDMDNYKKYKYFTGSAESAEVSSLKVILAVG